MYRNLHKFCVNTRQFRTRAGRQSIGLGASRDEQVEYDRKMNELDDRVHKLWEKAYDRIATFQRSNITQNQPYQNNASQTISNRASVDSNNHMYGHGAGATIGNTYGNSMGLGSSSQSNLGGGFSSQGTSIETPISSRNLNNPSIPPSMFALDDQKLMRLSFAEGYFYGQEGKKKPRFRLLTVVRDGIIMILLVTAGYSLLNGENPFRRVILGNRANEVQPEEIEVSFSDVKGCDESKQELSDIVEYLKKPNKFSRLGGKLPKGVLLVGPPGTGKTLLARAVAGEAGVPFFHASGSEFDEILVGQGARRVRDLFEKAKQRTPCVIFIDEIDSVGGKRTNSVLHPYANQTINQLLSEMDGFSQNEGVIVMGATNRANDLDKALLRPGRFDVQVTVPIPDYKGRKELFEHYLAKVRASADIDLDMLCRTSIGFTGADIENLVNQGALRSATEGMDSVTQESLEFARDKILMGPERRNRLPDKEQNLMTAYHEGGHALVAYYTEKANSLHKVTIVSRGNSLGHTSTLPERDLYSQTKEQLSAAMDVMLGGRVAEELIYGADRVTTGCEDDLRKANMLATKMVKDFGMSEKVGMRVVREEDTGSQIVVSGFSDATSELVESEISRMLEESKERVRSLLTQRRDELKLLAEALLKYETLDAAEVKLVIEGKDPKILRQEREKERKSRLNLMVGKPSDRLPLDLLKHTGTR